jgi:hypothetical protein
MMENTKYLYSLPHPIRMMNSRKVIWAANVLHSTEKRNILARKCERNRPFGIPRCK